MDQVEEPSTSPDVEGAEGGDLSDGCGRNSCEVVEDKHSSVSEAAWKDGDIVEAPAFPDIPVVKIEMDGEEEDEDVLLAMELSASLNVENRGEVPVKLEVIADVEEYSDVEDAEAGKEVKVDVEGRAEKEEGPVNILVEAIVEAHDQEDEIVHAQENKGAEIVRAVVEKEDEIVCAVVEKEDEIVRAVVEKEDEIVRAVVEKEDEIVRAVVEKEDEIVHAHEDTIAPVQVKKEDEIVMVETKDIPVVQVEAEAGREREESVQVEAEAGREREESVQVEGSMATMEGSGIGFVEGEGSTSLMRLVDGSGDLIREMDKAMTEEQTKKTQLDNGGNTLALPSKMDAGNTRRTSQDTLNRLDTETVISSGLPDNADSDKNVEVSTVTSSGVNCEEVPQKKVLKQDGEVRENGEDGFVIITDQATKLGLDTPLAEI